MNILNVKKIVMLSLFFTLAVGHSVPSHVAHAASKSLNVPAYKQAQSQWCWVAAPQIIINYHLGTMPAQCTLVKRGKQISTCPNEPGTLSQSKSAMMMSGISSGGSTALYPVSYRTVVSNINNNQPLILRKDWKDGNGKKTGVGHLAVIYGYNDSGNYVRTVRIRYSTDSFKTSTKYNTLMSNSTFAWTHTIYNIRK